MDISEMPENQTNYKRITKNTMFLYFRMILIMGVTLYTSRVILDKLGVEDYGLYQVVGGVVGMLSFLNGTLSIGTSRFLTYELGTGNAEKLKRTFSTGFYTHVILALIVVVLMETGGLWFLYNKLIIPAERLDACFWVFQLSIFTTFVVITQVPYTATIMAHERMGIYAYISIFESFAKLGVCYLLSVSSYDKLIFYAILIAIVQLLVAAFYRIYSIKIFIETKLLLVFDKSILKSMLGFSGWNIMANITETLKSQGIMVLINMFFAPAVAGAQAVANHVSQAIMQFVNNFRLAINPQIIKSYAARNEKASRKLTLQTTVYCFDLILILGLPSIIMMDKLMEVWLVEVPNYAIPFTQWVIICNIVNTFNASFYIPMMAANKIKSNSFAAVFIGIGQFVILYFLLKLGFGPMWIQYMGVIMAISFSLLVKPLILIREINYHPQEILMCYWNCIKVMLIACVFVAPSCYLMNNGMLSTVIKGGISFVATVFASYITLDMDTKTKLRLFMLNKLRKVCID